MIDLEAIEEWYAFHGARYPWRRTRNAYRIMLTEIMLQRTRADKVAEVYPVFFARFPTPQSIARARVTTVGRVLMPLGLNHRVPRIRDLGKTLSHLGNIPCDRKELLALPGVGPYVADAVLCYSFGKAVVPVDVNIKRLFGRCYGSEAVEENVVCILVAHRSRNVRSFDIRKLNWALLDLARVVCTTRSPRCQACPLVERCAYASRSSCMGTSGFSRKSVPPPR